MGNLFKIKQWLSVEDAANHLSTVFDEPVSAADILQLGLEGKLTLSVDLVNGAFANKGRMIPVDEGTFRETRALDGSKILLPRGVALGDDRVIELDGEVHVIKGIWNLPMYGSEYSFVKNEYLRLIGGPRDDTLHLDGAFLIGASGEVFRLLDRFDDHYVKRMRALSGDVTLRKPRDYYPARSLPDDCILCVLTKSLMALEHSTCDPAVDSDVLPSGRTVSNFKSDKLAYLNQAAALFWANADPNDRATHPDNKTVASWLENKGFSSTLADKGASIIRPEWASVGRKPEE